MIIKKSAIFILAGCVLLGISRIGTANEKVVNFNGKKFIIMNFCNHGVHCFFGIHLMNLRVDSAQPPMKCAKDIALRKRMTFFIHSLHRGSRPLLEGKKTSFLWMRCSHGKGHLHFGQDLTSALQATIPIPILTLPIYPMSKQTESTIMS
ncbi:hypothetical protein [Paraburkholderia kirstenboschensis]|uniref:hypothetical protein n=1 Tax=Paraburkholderia kirstenboschensis TaxID=1245436 RepID=UPI000FFC0377|nr:hypothetical protein [Paraburkholderia kirstenboschensis]